jgi:hypothetical protein
MQTPLIQTAHDAGSSKFNSKLDVNVWNHKLLRLMATSQERVRMGSGQPIAVFETMAEIAIRFAVFLAG